MRDIPPFSPIYPKSLDQGQCNLYFNHFYFRIQVYLPVRATVRRTVDCPWAGVSMASILRGRRLMKVMPENSGERCCVVGCSNRRGTDKKTGVVRSYHSIPKHPKRREQWIKAIPRTAWSPRQWDRVCSDHFVGGK